MFSRSIQERKEAALQCLLVIPMFISTGKGAVEIVLISCTSKLDPDGVVQQLTDVHKIAFGKSIEDKVARSLRCVASAYKYCILEEVPNEEERSKLLLPGDNLILFAIVGIKVRVVTGNNLQTTKAIAFECGIINSETEAMELALIEGKIF